MMCKPKDDLRKDCRLMEFNCLINKVRFVSGVALWHFEMFKIVMFTTRSLSAVCSVSVRMPSQGGGSYTSARTL